MTKTEKVKPEIVFRATPRQHQAWSLLTDKITNEILFGGGAGGGKTHLACTWLAICAHTYPGSRWLIGRRELKRLKQTVLVSLFDLFYKWGFRNNVHFKYNSQMSAIQFRNRFDDDGNLTFTGGSELILMDLAPQPSDPNYDRLGSLEITGAFIEEAAEVESKAKEVVLSRVRYRLDDYNIVPKLLMTCNPHKGYLYKEFYKPWKQKQLDPSKAFIRSLVTDNPHISPYYIESLKKIKDKVLRARLLLGEWEYADDDLALFDFDKLNDLFTNPEDDDTTYYITADVARFGRDKVVIMVWEGLTVIAMVIYEKSSMPTLETEILVKANQYKIPMSRVLVDEDGIGGGIVDHLKCKGFVGNATPIDEKKDSEKRKTEYKVNYQNLRTQCYYVLSEYCNDGIISIRSESQNLQDDIIEELDAHTARDVDKDVKFRILAKEDIKAKIQRSPDLADTLMMRMYYEVKPEKKRTRVHRQNTLS